MINSDLSCKVSNIELFNHKGHHMQCQRLIQGLILVSILAPNSVFSYTMADMEVNSALNQKLDADIPIRLTPNEKPHDISVRMAAPIIFEQHKISHHSLLDKIQIKRIGTAIQITSKSPINTPTLDFLLEINSRKGPTYKRYKITFNKNSSENKVTIRDIEASKLIPVAINVSTKPVVIPINQRLNNDNTFGPIQKNDSLAKISKHIATFRNMNIKTVATALRHNNPNAFNKGRHGTLKTGEFLVIPDFNEVKPVEVTAIAPALIITEKLPLPTPTISKIEPVVTPTALITEKLSLPAPAINKFEPVVTPTPILSTFLASDINVQQLQLKVELLEHHVNEMQKELIILQTQSTIKSPVPAETQITADSAQALSIRVQDEPNPLTSINTNINPVNNIPLLFLDNPWLLIFLVASLMSFLAWVTMRLVNSKRVIKQKSLDSKNLNGEFKELDIDLPIAKKSSRAAPRNNAPKTASNHLDTENEEFEFDFLKAQVSTTKMKKPNRLSRYPSDIDDSLKK